jgi:hypothetical protein
VFTVNDQGDGNARLAKFVDGVLVGEQVVESARYLIDPAGLLVFADNDSEAYSGRVATFAVAFDTLPDAKVGEMGGAGLDGFFADPTDGVVQFDFGKTTFRGGVAAASLGEGTLTDRLFSGVYADDDGIPFEQFDAKGGFRVDAEYGSGMTSFTLVYDLILERTQPKGFGGLIQLDNENLSDGDLFFRDDGDSFGIGISGGKFQAHPCCHAISV